MNKQELLKLVNDSNDIRMTPILIPEWNNATFYVPDLTLGEVMEVKDGNDKDDNYALSLFSKYMLTESGDQVFEGEEGKAVLKKKSMKVIRRVLNDIGKAVYNIDEAVEVAKKN